MLKKKTSDNSTEAEQLSITSMYYFISHSSFHILNATKYKQWRQATNDFPKIRSDNSNSSSELRQSDFLIRLNEKKSPL